MIIKVYPSAVDFDNVSRLRTETSAHANEFDYTRVVVNKPWGYEYLWYQNSSVAVWMLYLEHGKATSLHAHLKKRTSLIVISGQVVCSTLEDRYKLAMTDSVVLEPCVFHTTQAVSSSGAFLIEVETPPIKGDLVRLKDNFGRAGTGYEQQSQYSNDFSAYVYQPFGQEHEKSSQTFGLLNFSLHSIQTIHEARLVCANKLLIVPFLGKIGSGKPARIETGEAANPKEFDFSKLPASFPPVLLLVIDSVQPSP
jgi:mannose-6-phosphate isomerase-like protein (cupin superfamily)